MGDTQRHHVGDRLALALALALGEAVAQFGQFLANGGDDGVMGACSGQRLHGRHFKHLVDRRQGSKRIGDRLAVNDVRGHDAR